MSVDLDTNVVREIHRVIPTADGFRVERRQYSTSSFEQGVSVTTSQQWYYEVYNKNGQIETSNPPGSVNINT